MSMTRRRKILLSSPLFFIMWYFGLHAFLDSYKMRSTIEVFTKENISHRSNENVHSNYPSDVTKEKDITQLNGSSTLPATEYYLESTTNKSKTREKFILLLSSVGRSGSTFLGEILHAQGNNVYFFEPLRIIPHQLQNRNTLLEEMLRNYHCQIDQKLLEYGKTVYVSVKHPKIKDKDRSQLPLKKVKDICLQENLRILKTIRTRMNWTRALLDDENLDFKVIHLVRDPRGSYSSMENLEWNMTIDHMCAKIGRDLHQRKEMESKYPKSYYFIKYEDLCLHPYEKVQEIFRFLQGKDYKSLHEDNALEMNSMLKKNDQILEKSTLETDSKLKKSRVESENTRETDSDLDINKSKLNNYRDIPESVFQYLKTHTNINLFTKVSPWTTKRDSSAIYQKWRKRISIENLLNIENSCGEVIHMLGHRTFGSIRNARNMTMSLFL